MASDKTNVRVDASNAEGVDAYPLCSTLRPRFNLGRDVELVFLKRNLWERYTSISWAIASLMIQTAACCTYCLDSVS